LAEEPWLGDPAELALASPLGFSGPVWLRLPKPSPQVQEWSEPPRWLTQDISGLGASFASVPGLAAWPSPPVAERPAPAYAGLPWQTNSSFTNSHLRVEALAGRPLLSEFSLPKWPFGDVLAPSTVQVLVSTQGTVMSATLLAGSGLAAADQRALELARSARFAPAPTAGLAWGRLVFEWHTQPEGAALPAPPASR
jgi:TonB family protein